MKKVCVVIVTFNRKNFLAGLIEKIPEQTYPISAILIYDNCSTDGTADLLKETKSMSGAYNVLESKTIDNIQWMYYRSSQNTGGSGGFHHSIKIASGMDMDYLWVMDDDVMPENNCLENLLRYASPEVGICVPTRTDNNFCDYAIKNLNLTNPFRFRLMDIKELIPVEKIYGGMTYVVDMPFEGPLISTEVIHKIGYPKEDLFLVFDDTDYAVRASDVTKIAYITDAVLHRLIIPPTVKGRLMDWKDYYIYRNMIWFYKQYGKNWFVRELRPVLVMIDLYARATVLRKWSNYKVLRKAYADGIRGRLGKRVEPGTLGRNIE